MKKQTDIFVVKSSTPPTVEFDAEALAAYIRFQTAKVAKTLPTDSEMGFMSVDLDAKGEVVGIEVIGAGQIEISAVLKQVHVQTPNIDYSHSRLSFARPSLQKTAVS